MIMRKRCFFVFLILFLLGPFVLKAQAISIKEPNVAGAFYPSDKDELTRLIEKYLRQASDVKVDGEALVLISPHAGYIYSGPVAAYGFKALMGKNYDTVIILAPTHYFPFSGGSVYQEGLFRTPLGDLEVDSTLASALIAQDPKLLFFKPQYYELEHSVEVELPFLQTVLKPGFKILPVLLGEMSFDECGSLAGYIAAVVKGKNVLVLASTDLSHYKPYLDAVGYDDRTIAYVKASDAKGLWDAVADTGWNVCGFRAVATGLLYAKYQGADKINVLKYANSGDTAGDKTRVVGYLSAIISKTAKDPVQASGGDKDMLTKEDKKRLLEIARSSIEAHLAGKALPLLQEKSPGLNLKRGAFVTLTKKGELRGCIGLFSSEEPLYEVVSKMSIESSTHDYRFNPVTADELKDIKIEISVLSESQLIDDWRKIRLGVDGVIIRRGYSSGVFLPQVATETGWDLETFLGQLCFQKAGLPWDCFKDHATKIYTFQAEVFSEI